MPHPTNSYEYLLPPNWKRQVAEWLAEDTPSFDYAGYVVGEVQREAFLLGKGNQPAVLAGCPFVTEIFNQLGCELRMRYLTSLPYLILQQDRVVRQGGRDI